MASFQFVVFGDDQPDTRKAIRSHVMKGKNAGRKLPPRQKKKDKRNMVGHDGSSEVTQDVTTRTAVQTVKKTVPGAKAAKQPPSISIYDLARVPQTLGHEFSWREFPESFTTESIDLFRFFYYSLVSTAGIPPFCRPKDKNASFFWRFSILDEAFMHSIIAIIGALKEEVLPTPKSPRLVLSHVSRGLHLVNKRLENLGSRNDVSDSTIAAILLLSMYERLRGDYIKASVHLQGLKRIIDLRGGISQLYRTHGLASKICRIDIDLALHFGTETVFRAVDTMPAMHFQGGQLSQLPLLSETDPDQCYGVVAQLSPKYSDLMRDVMRMSNFFNKTVRAPVLDVYASEALMVNICYRIVELRPLRPGGQSRKNSTTSDSTSDSYQNNQMYNNSINVEALGLETGIDSSTSPSSSPGGVHCGLSNLDDACHLGMAAFMTTMLMEFGAQLVTYELLTGLLEASIKRLISSGVQNLRAALWLCFVGGISVFHVDDKHLQPSTGLSPKISNDCHQRSPCHDSNDDRAGTNIAQNLSDSTSNQSSNDGTWLLPIIHEISQDLGLASWSDVLAVLEGFPWVHVLHDRRGETLWQATTASIVRQESFPGNVGEIFSGLGPEPVFSFPWEYQQDILEGILESNNENSITELFNRGSTSPPQGSEIISQEDSVQDIRKPLYGMYQTHRRQPLRPLQTLTHEPGVSLSHPKYGLWE